MTTPINKILTNQMQELSNEQLANVSASLSAILGQGGGGGGGGEPCASAWRPVVDNEGIISWTLTTATNTPTPVNITGPQGPQGPSGTSGAKGDDGTSVIVKSIREFNDVVGTHTKGGTEITLEWNEGQTVKTSAFSAFNGEKGQDGAGASYSFDAHTLSGDGSTTDIGVNTNVIATQAWVGAQNYLTSVPDSYATKTYANDASANALSQAQSWVGTQGYLTQTDLEDYATKTYVDTASAETLSQAELWVNQQNFATSAGLAADKLFAMTTAGWTDFTIPSTSGYLPLSGGTVSGQLVVSGGSNFDQQFLKIIRENVNGYGRIGLGQSGPLALKVDDANQHTTQINISPNTTNDQLVQVQHNGNTVGYLIPAVTAATTAGLTDDGILHIIVEN